MCLPLKLLQDLSFSQRIEKDAFSVVEGIDLAPLDGHETAVFAQLRWVYDLVPSVVGEDGSKGCQHLDGLLLFLRETSRVASDILDLRAVLGDALYHGEMLFRKKPRCPKCLSAASTPRFVNSGE